MDIRTSLLHTLITMIEGRKKKKHCREKLHPFSISNIMGSVEGLENFFIIVRLQRWFAEPVLNVLLLSSFKYLASRTTLWAIDKSNRNFQGLLTTDICTGKPRIIRCGAFMIVHLYMVTFQVLKCDLGPFSIHLYYHYHFGGLLVIQYTEDKALKKLTFI